jgi:ABC-type antimicrobial peptide transport system permease subunit
MGQQVAISSGQGIGLNPIRFDVAVKPDNAVLGFNAGISLLTAILFGLVPALRATRIDLAAALKRMRRPSATADGDLAGCW